MIALVPLVAAAAVAAPTLTDVRVETGSHPFAGDHRLLATVSPNGDGFRDRAIVRFRLDKPARVRLDVLRTDTIHLGKVREQVVWRTQRRLGAGRGQLAWRPARSTPPRTYVLRLTAVGRGGRRVVDNARPGAHRAPVVRVQGIVAGFPLRSYAPGEPAPLTLATDAREVRLQVFHYSSERGADFKTAGTAKTAPLGLDWSSHRDRPATLDFVRAGDLAQRSLLPAGERRRRPARLRALHRPAEALRRNEQDRRRSRDQHVAGVQLLGRRRRRLGRLLVCERRGAKRRPAPAVPRLRRPVPFP